MSDDPLARLTKLFARLPGIGEKSGARLAYYVWRSSDRYARELAEALVAVKDEVRACQACGAPDVVDPCAICADEDRDRATVMVVEGPQDLTTIEKTGVYRGLYHVLGGTLSPVAGRGPDKLNLASLFARIDEAGVKEIILATNPSVEGDATASYLEQELAGRSVELSVSRLARGMPIGSEIKYLDPASLGHAVKDRK